MRISSWIRLGISAGVAGLILWRVPTGTLGEALIETDATWMWAALVSTLAMLAVRSSKWHGLLEAAGVETSRSKSAFSLLGGFTLAAITPGRLGELGRWIFVAEGERARVLLLNILDRVFDCWGLFTCAVASLLMVRPLPYGVFALAVWLALVPVIAGAPGLVSCLGEWRRWGQTFGSALQAAGQSLLSIRTTRFVFWGMTSTALDALTFYFLLRAFGPAGLSTAVVSFPWIVLAGAIPLTLSGLGFREGAAVWLLARQAVPSAVAVDVALLLSAFSTLLPASAGGFWLLLRRGEIPWRRMWDIRKAFENTENPRGETSAPPLLPLRPAVSKAPATIPARVCQRPLDPERIL